jgi:cyclic-di-GMP phosphodiesterase, flagellum assembly factor TipF
VAWSRPPFASRRCFGAASVNRRRWRPWPVSWWLSAVSVSWIRPAPTAAARRPDAQAAVANPELAERLNALTKRFDAMEARLNGLDQTMIERTRATIRAVSAELDAVGSVVRELAEAVAMHDSELFAEPRPRIEASIGPESPPNPAPQPEPPPARAASLAAPAEPAPAQLAPTHPEPPPQHEQPAPTLLEATPALRPANSDIRALLPVAISQDRLELHLQSIVTLPQRKVRLYEAMHYLRGDNNRSFTPADLREEAESAFAEGPLDNHLIRRSQRVIRHLKERNREVALLCRVSSRSFFLPEVFNEIARIAKTNRDDAQHLVFCLDQAAVRAMGPLELENLDALQRMGYRLALDGVTDLRVDPRQLVERGFRYMKVPADLLLMDETGASQSEFHPADLSGLLARHGMTLIACGISSEKTVLDLLDFNVPLAQGSVFAPPRAVRIDLLDGEGAGRPPPQTPPQTAPEIRQEEVRSSFRAILRRANG